MSIAAVVLRGYGNGTVTGTIPEVVTRGYTIGVALEATSLNGEVLIRSLLNGETLIQSVLDGSSDIDGILPGDTSIN